MPYTKQVWADGDALKPLSALRMNYLETGLEAAGIYDGAIVIASIDSPSRVRAMAQYVCDGTADQVEINAAILAASSIVANGGVTGGTSSGRVILTGGRFYIDGSILMRTGVVLSGQGLLTEVRNMNLTTVTGVGAAAAMIKYFDNDTHSVNVQNMQLNGNGTSGGAGSHAISFDSSSSVLTGGGVNTNPDTYTEIGPYVFIRNHQGTGTGIRYGIHLHSTTSDNRGTRIHNVTIRNAYGGIYVDSAPDGDITMVHVGGTTEDGIYINGGNWRIVQSKCFYADGYGFNLTNARLTLSCCEAQDCENGFFFAGSQQVASVVSVDTCGTDGIVVNSGGLNLQFTAFVRSGGRYATTVNAIRFVGTPTDCNINGVITAANITNKIVGTTSGARNHLRITDGSSLLSVG